MMVSSQIIIMPNQNQNHLPQQQAPIHLRSKKDRNKKNGKNRIKGR